jgi:hypothetical protein
MGRFERGLAKIEKAPDFGYQPPEGTVYERRDGACFVLADGTSEPCDRTCGWCPHDTLTLDELATMDGLA